MWYQWKCDLSKFEWSERENVAFIVYSKINKGCEYVSSDISVENVRMAIRQFSNYYTTLILDILILNIFIWCPRLTLQVSYFSPQCL